MSIYTKDKTTVSNLSTVDNFDESNAFKVGIAKGTETLIINYLTNLYSNPAIAIVRELFTNACDATGGDGEISISIEKDRPDSNTFNFTIIDYGCGMSAEELRDNYVTYANSTKTEDYDSIGSFGLGSKSPMAIVPSYTITSCNGEEQNTCVVARTENGIFGKIEKDSRVSPFSFTKVSFNGVSFNYASKMDSYIRNKLIPFSFIDIKYESKFHDENDKPYTAKEYEYEIELPVSDAYTVTMYTNSIDDFYKVYRSKNFKYRARINNISYPINGINDNSSKSSTTIVIDVEPGYFAFAPSREELPSGENLNHIIEILNAKYWDSYDEFITWMIENVSDVESVYEHEEDNKLFAYIDDASCFVGLDKKSIDKINKINRLRKSENEDVIDDDLINNEDVEVLIYSNNKHLYEKRTPDSMYGNLGNLVEIFRSNVNKEKKNDSYYLTRNWYVEVNIVNGVKKNRNGKFNIPSDYRVQSVSKYIYEKKCEFRSLGNGSDISWEKFNVIYVFVTEGKKLPDTIEFIKDYLCIDKDCNVTAAKESTINYEAAKAKAEAQREKKPKVGVEDRVITYYTREDSYNKQAKLSEFVDAFDNNNYYIYYDGRVSGKTVPVIDLITGKVGVSISDHTKMVRKYLENKGYKFFAFDCDKFPTAYFDSMYKLKESTRDMNKFTYSAISNLFKLTNNLANVSINKRMLEVRFGLYNISDKVYEDDPCLIGKILYAFDNSFKSAVDGWAKPYLKREYSDITDVPMMVKILKKCNNSNYEFNYFINRKFSNINTAYFIDSGKIIKDQAENIIKDEANKRIDASFTVNRFFDKFDCDMSVIECADSALGIDFNSARNVFANKDERLIAFKTTINEFEKEPVIRKFGSIYGKLTPSEDDLDKMIVDKVDGVVSDYKDKISNIF